MDAGDPAIQETPCAGARRLPRALIIAGQLKVWTKVLIVEMLPVVVDG
jgi:hypothetical protein